MNDTNFLTVNKSSVFEVINEREGIGSINVEFEDIESESLMNQALEACNLISPRSVFMKELSEGKFQLFFTSEYKKGSLNPDDINIAEIAQKAKNSQSEVPILISGRLHKLATKIAKQYGVKFTGDSFTSNGAESIIERMKKAVAAGLLKMDLQTTETTIHTVRAYCAILKNTYNKTIYCRQNGPVITVWFRTPTQAEKLTEEIKDRLKQGEGVFSEGNIIDIMNSIWPMVPDNYVVPQVVDFEELETPAEEFRYLAEVDATLPTPITQTMTTSNTSDADNADDDDF